MVRAPVIEFNPASDLMGSPEFRQHFTDRLVAHHATHAEALNKLAFEYAFVDACKEAGWDAKRGTSATHPGADVIVDGVGFSLKTQGDKKITFGSIFISKLRESAGMKGKTSQSDYLAFVNSVILPHLHSYERVLMLRSFTPQRVEQLAKNSELAVREGAPVLHAEAAGNEIVYQLVEIPVALLRRIDTLVESEFSPAGRSGGARAIVKTPEGHHAFDLYFDGSDDKIQVQKLDVSLCTIHGTWSIPIRQ